MAHTRLKQSISVVPPGLHNNVEGPGTQVAFFLSECEPSESGLLNADYNLLCGNDVGLYIFLLPNPWNKLTSSLVSMNMIE
jgi:hypothetical protein